MKTSGRRDTRGAFMITHKFKYYTIVWGLLILVIGIVLYTPEPYSKYLGRSV